jgi:hypothetical protein
MYVVGKVEDNFLEKPTSVNKKDITTWTLTLGISVESFKSIKAIMSRSPNPVKTKSKLEPIQIFRPFHMFK